MSCKKVLIINDGSGFKFGTIGYADIDIDHLISNETITICKDQQMMKYLPNKFNKSSCRVEHLIPFDENLKNNKKLLNRITELQEQIDCLTNVVNTGEIPPDKETIEKAKNIIDAVKALKNNDESSAITAIIKALKNN